MRVIEAAVFLTLAAGVHAGLWLAAPIMTGTASSGSSGAAEVTVLAATPAQAAMIARWQQPPDVTDRAPVAARAPAMSLPDTALALPGLTPPHEVTASATPPSALSVPAISGAPQIDATPAAPPDVTPPPEIQRPRARPEKLRQIAHASNQTAQPEQRARGEASRAQKGRGGADAAQSQDAERTKALRAQWGSKIHAEVQRNLTYPRGSRGSGTAKLALEIAPNGNLLSLSLLRSSGNAVLDKAAMTAVHRAGQFAKAPRELSDPKYAFSLSLTFNR